MKEFFVGILFFCNSLFAMNDFGKRILKHSGIIQSCQYDKTFKKLIFCIKENGLYYATIYDPHEQKSVINNLVLDQPITVNFHPNHENILVYQTDNNIYIVKKGTVIFNQLTTLKTSDKCLFFGKKNTKFFNYYTPPNSEITKDDCGDNYYQLFDIKTKQYKEFGISSSIYQAIVDYDTHEHLILKTSKGLYHCDSEGKLTFLNDDQYALFDKTGKNLIFFDYKKNIFNKYNLQQYEIVLTQKVEKPIEGNFLITNKDRVIFTDDGHYFYEWNIDNNYTSCIKYFDSKHLFFRAYFLQDDIKNAYHFSEKEAVGKENDIIQDSARIICFSSTERKEATLYLAKMDHWVDIELPVENRGFLKINSKKTYAVYYSYAANTVYIYNIQYWSKIKEYSFDGASIVGATFSPCGDYIEISYQKNKDNTRIIDVVLYDIKKDKIVAQDAYHYLHGHLEALWTNSFFVFIKKDLKTLCLINYKENFYYTVTCRPKIASLISNSNFTLVLSDAISTIYYAS